MTENENIPVNPGNEVNEERTEEGVTPATERSEPGVDRADERSEDAPETPAEAEVPTPSEEDRPNSEDREPEPRSNGGIE